MNWYNIKKKRKIQSTPKFAPAGPKYTSYSRATQENDFQIIQVADHFIIISTWNGFIIGLCTCFKWCSFASYWHTSTVDSWKPVVSSRLAYAMVLKPMKFSKNNPFLDLEVDPKWAGVAKHHAISSNNSACTAGNDSARSRNWCQIST
jgi:hypothetical protein